MAEVGHVYVEDNTHHASSSSTYVDVSNNSRLPAASIDASSEYLLVVGSMINANNTGNNSFEYQLFSDDVGGELSFSHARLEPRRSTNVTGHPYFYMDRYDSDGAPDDIDARYHTNGSVTGQQANIQMWMLKLDDLVEDTDFFWDEDLTVHSSLNSAAWQDGPSVTIGDGAKDFAIYYTAHVLVDSTSAAIRLRVDVGGAPTNFIELEGEDSAEELCIGGLICIEAPAAGTVVKIQVQTDSSTAGAMDVDCMRLMVLDLDAFEDHFTKIEPTDVNITVDDTDFVTANVLHTTSTAASEDWAIQGFAINDVDNSNKRTERMIDESGVGLVCGNRADNAIQNSNTDQTPLQQLGQKDAVADSTSFDFDYIVREEGDVTPEPVIIDTWLFGFTYQLAVSGDIAAALNTTLAVAADLDAAGTLAAAQSLALTVAADLSAVGKIEAAAALVLTVAADLKATGKLQAATSLQLSVLADMNALGVLSAAASLALSVAADLDAQGKLESAAALAFTVAADLQEAVSSDLQANLQAVLTATPDLDASGTLVATPAITAAIAANVNAPGTLAASPGLVLSATADLEAAGKLEAATTLLLQLAADLEATGQLAAAPAIAFNVAADLMGEGKLEAAHAIALTVTADITAAATNDLSANLQMAVTVTPGLTASGSLSAATEIALTLLFDLGAVGRLQSAHSVSLAVVADLRAAGSLAATPSLSLSALAGLDSTGRLDAATSLSMSVVADLDAAGQVAVVLPIALSVAADVKAPGELAAAAQLILSVLVGITDANATKVFNLVARDVTFQVAIRTLIEFAEKNIHISAFAEKNSRSSAFAEKSSHIQGFTDVEKHDVEF